MADLACGCPGAQVRTLNNMEQKESTSSERLVSELRQWPTQLQLVPPTAPYLDHAHLLIAADCVPFAYAEFHRDFIKGRVLVNACPKLDDSSSYIDKQRPQVGDGDDHGSPLLPRAGHVRRAGDCQIRAGCSP